MCSASFDLECIFIVHLNMFRVWLFTLTPVVPKVVAERPSKDHVTLSGGKIFFTLSFTVRIFCADVLRVRITISKCR